jgi:hypothetical protein
VLCTSDGDIEMEFVDSGLVLRILKFHGEKNTVFKIERVNDVWRLRGMNPKVTNEFPLPRGMSEKFDERKPDPMEKGNVDDLLPDAIELLRKGSESKSQQGSYSRHARIGDVSLQARLGVDGGNATDLKNEMLANSYSMDKVRYLQVFSLLSETVFSRLNTVIQDAGIKDKVLIKSRTTLDSALEVCHVFTYN